MPMPVVSLDTQTQELLGEAAAKRKEASTLVLNKDCTAEDVQKAEQLDQDADLLTKRASFITKAKLNEAIPTPDAANERKPSEFKTQREFVKALAEAHTSKGRIVDPRLRTLDEQALTDFGDSKGLSSSTGASGGYLLPTTQETEIFSLAAPESIVRPRANVMQVSGRLVSIPALDQSGTDASDHILGGWAAYWTEEGEELTESEIKFRQLEIVARELACYTDVPNSLLKDVPALTGHISGKMGFPKAAARAQDRAFLKGNGVGKPLGILNAPALKVVTRTSSADIKYEDLVKMHASFMGEDPVWVASQAAIEKLMLMNGPTGNPMYLWGDAVAGQPNRLLGTPIMFNHMLPGVGTKGDIMLCDFSYYLIAELEAGTTVESSEHPQFRKNRTVFRLIQRVDGQPMLNRPYTLEDGTTTLSPFVALSTL